MKQMSIMMENGLCLNQMIPLSLTVYETSGYQKKAKPGFAAT